MKNKITKYIFVFSTIIMTLFFFVSNVSAVETSLPSCDSVFGSPTEPDYPAYWIQLVLDVIKYIAIVALLGLSIADFVKAIVSDDKDALKKAGITSFKRFIYCVIIFFLPILVNFLMELFGFYSDCDFR